MHMIGHPAECMQAVPILSKHSPYDRLPDVPVMMIQTQVLPGIATQYDMVKATTYVDTGFACHSHLNKKLRIASAGYWLQARKQPKN